MKYVYQLIDDKKGCYAGHRNKNVSEKSTQSISWQQLPKLITCDRIAIDRNTEEKST